MIRFTQSKNMIMGIVMLVIVSTTGCGIVPIDVRYVPSGNKKSVAISHPKVNLQIKDAREKKVFFRTVLGDNGDNGENGILKLTRTPNEVFNEGFTEALQVAGCQVRKDTDIVYEVGIQRFLAIDMQKSPHFLDSDIMLEILVKHSEQVLARKIIFERDTEKQVFGQVWQDTVPPLLSRSLSHAIEKAVWEPSIIAAIEQANGSDTMPSDVSTRLQAAASTPSPNVRKSKPASYTSLNTTYDKNR